MMKKSEIFKRALEIEIKDIIGKKFDSKKEDHNLLPIRYPHREMAEKITFSGGFLLCLGINLLILIFVVFRFTSSFAVIALSAVLGIILAFLGGCLIATVYLYAEARAIIREEEREAAKTVPTARELSDAAYAERMKKKERETVQKQQENTESDK